MKVHAIEVGRVRVHKEHIEGSRNRLWVFFSKDWAGTIPIHVYLIEHPNGLILFDTGESPKRNEPSYIPWWSPRTVEFDLKPEDAIDKKLKQLGYRTEDIQHVILSHLHTDHIGGVHLFPHATVYVTKNEWKDAHRFGASLLGGYHKAHFDYPNHTYKLLDFIPMKEAAVFERGYDIFQDRTLILVPTPGHTRGHQSLLIYDENPICIAGDAVFSEVHLREGIVDGVSSHPKLAQQTIQKLQLWSKMHNHAHVLGTHDPRPNIIIEERSES
ncbi:N-acyl homoserine lactonase family protein [Paenibacillus caui]|uniref:N-acyl homoserine lactonase family protein n=1 Tax=Paenibacillus caui TaxID=2873927 RepID=UPI001CA9D995|nr:N-acyl homoserine lactonase family protein [Paenibacillus caui]